MATARSEFDRVITARGCLVLFSRNLKAVGQNGQWPLSFGKQDGARSEELAGICVADAAAFRVHLETLKVSVYKDPAASTVIEGALRRLAIEDDARRLVLYPYA